MTMMKDKIRKILSDKRCLIIVYIVSALTVSFQSLTSHTKTYDNSGTTYKTYNNYIIFERSFHHLKNNQDLYVLYPQEHWDLYKYTPSFSAFFGFFSMFPDWLGLILWNLLNTIIVLLAIYSLPKLDNYQKGLILTVILLELIGSVQNLQSNALIAGLIVLSFCLLEKNKSFFATLCIVFAAFIKLFGIVGFAIFLLYPKKAKSALYAVFWTTIFLLVPLLFTGYEQYINLFKSYLNLLIKDHEASYGYSVMGWLHSWLSVDINKSMIVAFGTIVFLLPFYKIKMYGEITFKYLILSSILIWIVIFNHKAEPATFVIAMTGVSLWFIQTEKNLVNIFLFLSVFILTTISSTDIFPAYIRDDFIRPYRLKAFPCILVWFKIIYDLITLGEKNIPHNTVYSNSVPSRSSQSSTI